MFFLRNAKNDNLAIIFEATTFKENVQILCLDTNHSLSVVPMLGEFDFTVIKLF